MRGREGRRAGGRGERKGRKERGRGGERGRGAGGGVVWGRGECLEAHKDNQKGHRVVDRLLCRGEGKVGTSVTKDTPPVGIHGPLSSFSF